MARPKTQETIEKENLIRDICEAMDKLKGRSIMGYEETKYVFSLYNRYYNTNEKNYTCDLCAIRVVSSLMSIRDNNKKLIK